jgi:hypothetical protein
MSLQAKMVCLVAKDNFLSFSVLPVSGAENQSLTAADAAVWSLVGLLFFCIACLIASACILRKRSLNPSAMEGLKDESETLSLNKTESNRAEWEKPADWWKS